MTSKVQRTFQTYSKIDLDVQIPLTQTRKELVKLVLEDQRSLSKSTAKLGIKLSTAKIILRKYKLTGEFFESKADRIRRQLSRNRIIDGSKEVRLLQNKVPNLSIQNEEQNSNFTPIAVLTQPPLPSSSIYPQPNQCYYSPAFWLFWNL